MATVKVESVGSAKGRIGGIIEVKIEVRASTGRYTFPFEFEDQGSPAANERQAYQELRTFLQEALAELGNR